MIDQSFVLLDGSVDHFEELKNLDERKLLIKKRGKETSSYQLRHCQVTSLISDRLKYNEKHIWLLDEDMNNNLEKMCDIHSVIYQEILFIRPYWTKSLSVEDIENACRIIRSEQKSGGHELTKCSWKRWIHRSYQSLNTCLSREWLLKIWISDRTLSIEVSKANCDQRWSRISLMKIERMMLSFSKTISFVKRKNSISILVFSFNCWLNLI